MIPVVRLLYKIDQKLNNLATNNHQEIQLEDKILALNEAQITLINNKVTGFSPQSQGMGLDAFKKRYSDLQNLIIPYSEGSLALKLSDPKLNQWTSELSGLKKKMMFYIDAYAIASKDTCKDRMIWINNDLTKHSDVTILLNNEHTKPSFEWQETFSTLSSDRINIFSDGTFNPSKIFISYLRYPVSIDSEGYVHFSGENSTNVDCELEDYLENELVNIAVMHLGMYTENSNAVQNSQLRIQTSE